MRRLLLGLPPLALLVLCVFALTPCLARCGDADELVTRVVNECPRARELLGDDARPARLGMACGTTELEGSYGRSSWSLPYTGSRGRGTVEYAAQKQADEWRLDAASLEVDGETIDLLACVRQKAAAARGATGGSAVLAQTNADATQATFEGKVLRSTHPTIREGVPCRGTLSRERGSPFAKLQVTCEAATVYDGTGSFTLDVRDPTRRDDDRSEYDDGKTSESDRTPGGRLSSSGATGTLTIWDTTPAAYELVVAL